MNSLEKRILALEISLAILLLFELTQARAIDRANNGVSEIERVMEPVAIDFYRRVHGRSFWRRAWDRISFYEYRMRNVHPSQR